MYHLPTFGQQAISPCLQEGTFTWRPTTPTKTLPRPLHLLLPYKPNEPQNCGFRFSKLVRSPFPRLQSLLESRGWWGLGLEPWMPRDWKGSTDLVGTGEQSSPALVSVPLPQCAPPALSGTKAKCVSLVYQTQIPESPSSSHWRVPSLNF